MLRFILKEKSIASIFHQLGSKIDNETLPTSYWKDNILNPVKFSQAMHHAISDGHRIFLEVAPHSVLGSFAFDIFRHEKLNDAMYLSSVDHTTPPSKQIPSVLATLFTQKYPINWGTFFHHPAKHLSLPLYPWQGATFWLDVSDVNPQTAILVQKDEYSQPISIQLSEGTETCPKLNQELTQLWASLLNTTEMGLDDHFLKLGGNSLLVTQMMIRINRQYNIELTIRDIHQFLTINKLSQLIHHKMEESSIAS